MKKITLVTTILVTALALSGCGIYTAAAQPGMPKSPDVITPGPVAPAPVEPDPAIPAPVKPADPAPSSRLTGAEAETIALKHAGLSAEQVNWLRSEYDFDDGVSHYDVEFRVGQWEYEYEIHAETGAVLSLEKDD